MNRASQKEIAKGGLRLAFFVGIKSWVPAGELGLAPIPTGVDHSRDSGVAHKVGEICGLGKLLREELNHFLMLEMAAMLNGGLEDLGGLKRAHEGVRIGSGGGLGQEFPVRIETGQGALRAGTRAFPSHRRPRLEQRFGMVISCWGRVGL